MKKSCFPKFIIIFTVVLAAIIYLVQNKFDELFLEKGKEFVLSAIEDGWNGPPFRRASTLPPGRVRAPGRMRVPV